MPSISRCQIADVELRPARTDHRQAIRDLHRASWATAYAPFVPARAMAGLDAHMDVVWSDLRPGVICAWHGGRLIGFVRVADRGGWPYIDNLHAAPDLRGRGIGAALLNAAFGALRPRGRCWLTVIAANAGARRFYRTHGGWEGAAFDEAVPGHPVAVLPVIWVRLPQR